VQTRLRWQVSQCGETRMGGLFALGLVQAQNVGPAKTRVGCDQINNPPGVMPPIGAASPVNVPCRKGQAGRGSDLQGTACVHRCHIMRFAGTPVYIALLAWWSG
jgi:hypothetical protein